MLRSAACLSRRLRARRAPALLAPQLAAFSSLPDGVEELTMPALSPTMTVGTIAAWLKSEGDALQAGDVLCQIETDKAVVDYEMQDDAVLARIVLPVGSSDIPVGATLAFTVEDRATYDTLLASGALSALQSGGSAATEAPAPASPEKTVQVETSAQGASHGHRQPLIKFLGKRSLLAGHAASTVHAAQPAAATAATAQPQPTVAAPTPPASSSLGSDNFTDIALSNMRKIIAKRLTASKVTAPHLYTSIDCEIDNVMKFRAQLKNKHSVKVSLNDFILKAVALALRDVPEANCYFDAAANSIKPNPSVDISVAVATATGLITPIVPAVDSLGLSGVNEKFMELVGRARQNKLKPEEFQGGSFTVSNLGGFGIDNFTAVINGQACIMAVGRGRKEVLPPVDLSVSDEPRLATLLNVTLSSDRRVVDNVVAAQFLQVFKQYMENPELLAL